MLSRTAAVMAALLAAMALAACGSDDEQAEVIREERRDAAQSARQDERIKQLQREEAEARSIQSQATSRGLDAGVLYSSNYRSLRPGYWVVFSGVFDSQAGAADRANRAKSLGYSDAYPRFVSP